MNKKRGLHFVLYISLCILMWSTAAHAVTKVKLAHVFPETHAHHIAIEKYFKPYVEKHTNGDLIIEIYPNSQLGGERQCVEGLTIGTLQMALSASSILTGFAPEFQVFDLPYLFTNKEEVYKAVDGQFGQKLNALLPPIGIRNIAYIDSGFRAITNNKGPIEKPEDMHGLKIRVQENPLYISLYRTLGASPVPINYGELYTALQQKTVDGQDQQIPLIYTNKFYEVQKYCSLTNITYTAAVLLVSEMWFQSLPEEYQNVLVEAGRICTNEQRKLIKQQEGEFIRLLKDEGLVINDITPENKAAFINITKPVYKVFTDSVKDGQSYLDIIATDIK